MVSLSNIWKLIIIKIYYYFMTVLKLQIAIYTSKYTYINCIF